MATKILLLQLQLLLLRPQGVLISLALVQFAEVMYFSLYSQVSYG